MEHSQLRIRRRWPAIVWLVLCGTALTLAAVSCNKSGPSASVEEKILYTCGMHPQVIQDKPGNCPICGMELTRVRQKPGASTNAPNPPVSQSTRKIMADEPSPAPAKK